MSNRYWIFGTIVIVGAVAALGWFLGIQPALQQAAATDASRVDVEAQNALYEAQLVQLREDFENIDELRADVEKLRVAIPNHADYAGFVAELNALAGGTATTVTSVTIRDATWYTAAPTQAAPAPAEGEVPAEGATAAVDGAAAAAEGEQVIPLPTADGTVNGSNFIAIPVQIQVSGDYLQFIKALQGNQRLFLVTAFNSMAGTPPTIEGLLYVLLGDPLPEVTAE